MARFPDIYLIVIFCTIQLCLGELPPASTICLSSKESTARVASGVRQQPSPDCDFPTLDPNRDSAVKSVKARRAPTVLDLEKRQTQSTSEPSGIFTDDFTYISTSSAVPFSADSASVTSYNSFYDPNPPSSGEDSGLPVSEATSELPSDVVNSPFELSGFLSVLQTSERIDFSISSASASSAAEASERSDSSTFSTSFASETSTTVLTSSLPLAPNSTVAVAVDGGTSAISSPSVISLSPTLVQPSESSLPEVVPVVTSFAGRVYGFEGCFDARYLSSNVTYQPCDLTPNWCANACSNNSYFGLSSGTICICFSSLAEVPSGYVEDCDVPCNGNLSKACGGTEHGQVYGELPCFGCEDLFPFSSSIEIDVSTQVVVAAPTVVQQAWNSTLSTRWSTRSLGTVSASRNMSDPAASLTDTLETILDGISWTLLYPSSGSPPPGLTPTSVRLFNTSSSATSTSNGTGSTAPRPSIPLQSGTPASSPNSTSFRIASSTAAREISSIPPPRTSSTGTSRRSTSSSTRRSTTASSSSRGTSTATSTARPTTSTAATQTVQAPLFPSPTAILARAMNASEELQFGIALPWPWALYTADTSEQLTLTTNGLLTIGDSAAISMAYVDNSVPPPASLYSDSILSGTVAAWWQYLYTDARADTPGGGWGIWSWLDANRFAVEWRMLDVQGAETHFIVGGRRDRPGVAWVFYFSAGDGGRRSTIGVQGISANQSPVFMQIQPNGARFITPGTVIRYDTRSNSGNGTNVITTFDRSCFPAGTFPNGICGTPAF